MNEKAELTKQLTIAGFSSALTNPDVFRSRVDIQDVSKRIVDSAKMMADSIVREPNAETEVEALRDENESLNCIIKQLKEELANYRSLTDALRIEKFDLSEKNRQLTKELVISENRLYQDLAPGHPSQNQGENREQNTMGTVGI